MNEPNDKILEDYIQQVLKLQEEHQQVPLKVEELNRIAAQLGLSASDLDFIDQKFQDYFYRGKGYLRHQNWDKAIEELSQGLMIKPLHIESLFGLAEAYLFRWQAHGKKSDKAAALHYAERCLETDARHEGAFLLIGRLNRNLPVRKKRAKTIRWVILGFTSFCVIALIALLLFIINPFGKKENTGKQPLEEAANSQNTSITHLKDLNLKAGIFQEENARGLSLQTETSLLKSTSEGYAYELTGAIIIQKFEIETLILQLELKDEKQNVNVVELIPLWDDTKPILQPGDAAALKILLRESSLSPTLKEATLKVYQIKRYKVEEEIAPDTQIPVIWAQSKPKNLDVNIAERGQVISAEPESFTQQITLSYTNTGQKPIKKLGIQVRWLNKELQLIHTVRLDLLNLTDPALLTKQRRLAQEQFIIPYKLSDYLAYEVEILNIE